MQQATYEISESTQRLFYRVAGQTIVIETHDDWAAGIIKELFSGWYLTPLAARSEPPVSPAIVIRSSVRPPDVPRAWPEFEIAGGGVCFTDGETSYIDIGGSIISIGKSGHTAVEVWTNGRLEMR